MWIVDTAFVADRLDLLCELEQIANALAALEQRHGPRAEFDALRRRIVASRVLVQEQLAHSWAPRPAMTVH